MIMYTRLIFSFHISFRKKFKEMILIDQSAYEYKLTQYSYRKDLLDNFFNSIEDNVISIDPSYRYYTNLRVYSI